MKQIHAELTEDIIGIFYDVYNELKYGFLEKVYQNALFFELKRHGYKVEAQKKINVFFRGDLVGEYYADIVVDGLVILELKACEKLLKQHEWQLLNYLRCSDMEVGLLLNFGEKPEVKRKIYENQFKNKKSC